jgi:O-antigen ligase
LNSFGFAIIVDAQPFNNFQFRHGVKSICSFFKNTAHSMLLTTRLRLVSICFIAISVSLPMAWISLGKLVLFISCLIVLSSFIFEKKPDLELRKLWSVKLVLVSFVAFGASLLWTESTRDIALLALTKHSKLLEIAMLVCLIRSQREAKIAMLAFFASQAFFVLSSWIMVAGWRVPWATSALIPQYKNVVFSTYLDQTLIFAAAAAVFWHLRPSWTNTQWLKQAAGLTAIAAVINIVFFQEGKTGYVAALTVVTLAIMWQIPKRWRLAVLVIAPLTLGLLAYAGSSKFQSRVTQILNESQSYNTQGDNTSSSGFRLHAWRRSLEAIAEQPLTGHGVGSWTLSVKRIEGPDAQKVFGDGLTSNPHQEFLLWGVELGIGGTLLLLLLIGSLVRDAMTFQAPVMRATISVVAVMVVACLFNSSLYDALIGDFFCITLGLLLALGVRSESAGSQTLVHQHGNPA